MREGQHVPCPSPPSTTGEGFCSPSGRDDRVCGFQDHVSHLVRMRKKRDMARRDLVGRGLAPLRHPAMLLGMDHAILGTKQRPRRERVPRWLAGLGLKATGIWY